MNAPRDMLLDYLTIRRRLGYKLDRAEQLLSQFLDFLDGRGEQLVTIDNAVAWATLPADATANWWAFRLSQVRGFARYLHAHDLAHQVPPADLLPRRSRRSTPYLYSDDEIAALMRATRSLRLPLQQATHGTLIGLLAVTGMRVGEALRLDRADVDLRHGVMTVRHSKYGKSRLLPLHPSTVRALRAYVRVRNRHCPTPTTDAFLISSRGTRVDHSDLNRTFRKLLRRAGIQSRSPSCRPRPADFRHAFAVHTLIDWYRAGADVHAQLPLLSTYLGHSEPRNTYWYLQAAPELLALAAERLERPSGDQA
jgi:integrase/recombinase XerD